MHSIFLTARRRLALCHLLLIAGALLVIVGRVRALPVVLLAVGFGGVGAAWSRHTDESGRWLDLGGSLHTPRRSTVKCAAEHAPFALAGILLLYRTKPCRHSYRATR